MPEIRTLISSEVHEPKHISNTTSADAGKVITPLSNGTSELRNLTPAEVGVNPVYGSIALDNNTDSFTVAAAQTDASLHTESDYIALNSVRVPNVYEEYSNDTTFNAQTYGIAPSVTGDYRISFWLNISSDTNGTGIGIKFKNGAAFNSPTIRTDIKELGRVQNISGSIVVPATAGDEITLWIASDKNAQVTIGDMRLGIELLGGS